MSNSTNNEFEGYKPQSIKILKKFGAKTWSKIRIITEKISSEGIILPRNQFAPDGFVEIKLKNGYNIGIQLDSTTKIEVISQEPKMEVKFDPTKINKIRLCDWRGHSSF